MSCPRLFEPVDAPHLQTCAECRAVRDALSAPAPAIDVERLKGPALSELQRVPRARPWWLGAVGLLLACAAMAGLGVVLLAPSTVQHVSMTLRQASSAAWAVAMLAGAVLAVRPGGRSSRVALLLGVGACFALTLAAASGHDPRVGGVGCAIIEWAFALLPLGLALLVLTGFSFEATRALCAAVAATSAGMLAVHLHCPNGTLWHQGMFHLVPIAVLALVTLAVRRMLPSRSHAP